MTSILYGLLLFFSAAAVSCALTPQTVWLAEKIGAIDVPRDARRMHTRPIPRLGGLAILLATEFVTGLFLPATPTLRAVWLGGAVIGVFGMLDDARTLSPLVKLAGQLAGALLAVRCGAIVDAVYLFGNYLPLGKFAVPATVFWILLLTNAINLIDGLDGLSCGVSAISSLSVLVITAVSDAAVCAFTAAALCGACLGFYPHNRHPARVFAGDTGAQYLGFTLAVISVDGMWKLPLFLAVCLPPLVFLLPLFDTIFAATRRIAHGQSPFRADHGHMHHRLLRRGFSHRETVMLLWTISAVCGSAALMVLGHGV